MNKYKLELSIDDFIGLCNNLAPNSFSDEAIEVISDEIQGASVDLYDELNYRYKEFYSIHDFNLYTSTSITTLSNGKYLVYNSNGEF